MTHPSLWRRRHREITALAAALLALAASLAWGPAMGWVDGFLYDLSLAIDRARPGDGGEPVAVIALDRGSLASEELAATPRVLFGPVWAKLIDGLSENGVKAIGFDIIFSYSANRFPALDPHYDRGFYDALARHHERLVLARSAGLPVAAPIEAAVYDLDEDAGKDDPSAIGFRRADPRRRRRPAAGCLPFVDGGRSILDDIVRRPAGAGQGADNARLGAARAVGAARNDPDLSADRCPALPRPAPGRSQGSLLRQARPDRQQSSRGGPQTHPRPVHAAAAAAPAESAGGCSLARLGASHYEGRTTPGFLSTPRRCNR